MIIKKRAFVSFDEYCEYDCKFCYTYGIERSKIRTIDEIIDSIKNQTFDVIYVSQKNDNFSDTSRGIKLCYKLFERYKKSIFIITRNVLNDDEIVKLVALKKRMNDYNQELFFASSINALSSVRKYESNKTKDPYIRLNFIKRMAQNDFKPILMLRPIFPNAIIPICECLDVIDYVSSDISCVVSSGLGVNENVLHRLKLKDEDFIYNNNQEYLQGAIDCDIKFVNVDNELKTIKEKCTYQNIPFFEHSINALNYLLQTNGAFYDEQ